MHSSKVYSAALALGAVGFAAAQTCTKDIEIEQATQVIDCEVVDANIEVKESVTGEVVINGPEQLLGDLTIFNASGILSISSTTINSIEGKFHLEALTSLNSIRFDALESVNELSMIKLNRLGEIVFGTEGVTDAKTVTITDTDLDDLSGLKLTTVEVLQIDNNKRLTKFDSQLQNVTGQLIINTNGNDMEVTLNDLESVAEAQIRNVKSFKVPALTTVEASLRFDTNPNLESFSAPNLTEVTDSLSFIGNDALVNVSCPELMKISGDLTVINNTEITAIDGFPKLETVLGGIDLGGNFESVELPSLKKVAGSVSVLSTTDIEDFCKFFDDAAGSIIEGEETCKSEFEDAVAGGDTTGDGSGGSSDSSDEGDGAGMVSANTAFMGLAVLLGIAQLL